MSVVLVDNAFQPRAVWDEAGRRTKIRAAAETGYLEIGLLNNMPDAALRATERQFMSLLGVAPEAGPVRIRLFTLPEISRGAHLHEHIAALYSDIAAMGRRRLDGLIVTGCEPRTPDLAAEPYYPSLTRIIDWADEHTTSSIWSCLAAHVAVLHLDSIERQPLPRKCFGVFASTQADAQPLLANAPTDLAMPHSRLNDVGEEALRERGYGILTHSVDAGVGWFIKTRRSTLLFSQGHPEYDADTLLREYRRDVGRFLRGERATYPDMPHGYFDPATEEALVRFAAEAGSRRDPKLLDAFPTIKVPPSRWRSAAEQVYRNWLHALRTAKRERAAALG